MQRALVEPSALHDDGEMRALVLKEAEILQRVAVDDEEVGIGAGGDDAELTLHLQELGVDERRRADDLEGRQDLGADEKLAALMDMHRAEKVGAEPDLDAAGFQVLERAEPGGAHVLQLAETDLGEAELAAEFLQRVVGDEG